MVAIICAGLVLTVVLLAVVGYMGYRGACAVCGQSYQHCPECRRWCACAPSGEPTACWRCRRHDHRHEHEPLAEHAQA